MLMNEKNKEMERWASVVTLLSSILFFVFVCLFVCFVTRHQYGISAVVSQTSFHRKPLVASRNVVCFLRLIWNQEIQI